MKSKPPQINKTEELKPLEIIPPKKAKQNTFLKAMEIILNDGKMTREEWGNKGIYCHYDIEKGYLLIHKDNKDYQWVISSGDIEGSDWVKL